VSRLGRRAILTGVGAGLALEAIGRRLAADPMTPAPRRLVIVQQNNGTQQAAFWPKRATREPSVGALTSPILDPLLSDPRLAARTVVVKGVRYVRDAFGTDANEHDMGFARLWTGAPLLSIGGHPWGGAASVDQIVAQRLGVESLTLAIHASSLQPFPKPGFQHRRSFAYVAPGVHKLPSLDPLEAYLRWFAAAGAQDDETKKRLALRKSALDLVRGDLASARARVGAAERDKLDAHATGVRALEDRLSDLIAGREGPGAACSRKPATPPSYQATPALLSSDESAVPALAGTMIDLIAAAIACGVTRVATLQLGFAGGQWRFDWEGVGSDHHALAHLDTRDEGVLPDVTEKIVRVNRWYAKQVAALASKLDAIPEGDGTVLDHTLIVWSNELGRGDHSQENVPIVFVGGGLWEGNRVVARGPQTFQRVGCTVLRAMGVDAAGFGDAPDCGPLAGL